MAESQAELESREQASDFLGRRESGVHTFFERWQGAFRQSRHPLGQALHRFVRLDELKKSSAAVDYLYSRSTFALIDDAKSLSTTQTVEFPHRPVVRLEHVAATLLLRVHGPNAEARVGADNGIEQRLASALRGLPSTEALEQARRTRSTLTEANEWLLDPDLVDTCALAAYLVERTRAPGVPAVDLNDFVIALLLSPAGQKVVFENFLQVAVSSPPITIGAILRPVLEDLLSREPSFWDEALREIDEQTLDTSRQAVETRIPDYVADRPIETLRDDLLDFRGDARAVAEIVCQRRPGPPLAIGLFGDWGSGKSSFMNLLRQEIEQLTGQARVHEGATPFIKRAAHVLFNAWQYNDTQLWPALAENTFAQLRARSPEGLSRQLWEQVLKEIDNQVSDLEESADGLALELMQVQHRETEERDKLLNAENERDDRIDDARSKAIAAAGEHFADCSRNSPPVANGGNTVAELIDVAADATEDTKAGLWLDVANAIRIAWQLRAERWVLLVGFPVALALALGLAVVWGGNEVVAGLGVIAPLLPVIYWFCRSALPLVAVLADYRRKRAQAERSFRSTQRKTEIELARLRRDIGQKENTVRRKLSRAAQLKGRSPGQVLDFFLSEGAAVRALQDEVGIVSRVRRAFGQLNAVVRRHGDGDHTKGHEDADDTPQRIVFYIDDLDRCRAEQVVRVLEAVHLLLAFDRFVVVVGVDTRWLETSLMSFYEEQLRANRDDSSCRHGLAPDPRATVRDYVEKIFQVPIQIPRLTSHEGGTFAKLVEILSPVSRPGPTQEGEGAADSIRYRDVRPLEPLDVTVPEPERFREAVERAQLSVEEVGLLKQLGPLAGRSPRAVKRLLNLYRLLRATRTGSRLTEFLEGNNASGGWPDYPAVQLCLAIEVGLPAAQIHRFREAVIIAARSEGATIRELLASDAMKAFLENLAPTQPRDKVEALFRTTFERFGDSPRRLQLLRDIVIETSRFSFSPLGDRPLSSSASKPASASTEASKAQASNNEAAQALHPLSENVRNVPNREGIID